METQPSSTNPCLLVVGADSVIGASLVARLERTSWDVIGTTRRPETVDRKRLLLDLASDPDTWILPHPTAAVICASVTRSDEIDRHPDRATRVNVEGLSSLVNQLSGHATFTLFLSSGAVLDGSRPFCPSEACTSPATMYGRQKRELEKKVLGLGANGCVVRLPKVLEPGFPLFRGWAASLARDEVIEPFADVPLAPVPLWFAIEVLVRILDTRLSGVLQVSALQDITYAEAALHAARRLHAPTELVKPVAVRLKRPELVYPQFATMDTGRLTRELGLVPPDVWSAIDVALGLSNNTVENGAIAA